MQQTISILMVPVLMLTANISFGQTLLKQLSRGNVEFNLYDNGFKIKDLSTGTFIIETTSPASELPIGFASYPNTTVDYVSYMYSVVRDSNAAYQWWTNTLTTWSSNDPSYIINASFKNTSNNEVMNLHVELLSNERVKVEIQKAIPVSQPWKYRTRLRLKLYPDEYFLGFGTRPENVAFRNKKMLNWISEMRIANEPSPKPENQGEARVPFYISTRGYGLLLNENTCSSFDLGEADPNINEIATWEQHLNFTVYLGATPLDIIKNYTHDAGRLFMMPEPWVFGVWMLTKNRNGFQTETDRSNQVAAVLRNDSIPCSALWHHYWSKKILNILGNQMSWTTDAAYWPNYNTLVSNHQNQGFKVLHYYWPYIFNNDAEYSYANSQGYFMKNSLNATYLNQWLVWFNQVAEPDLTRQSVRNWYKNNLMINALNVGSSGWMADFGEHHRIDMIDSANGNPYTVHNEYPLWWAKTNQEFWQQHSPNGDYVYFMRGGWTGMQKHAPVMINDPDMSWSDANGIKGQIANVLTGGISGHPLVCPHVGGYKYGAPVVLPSNTEELWIRWLEMVALLPVLWTHEGDELYLGTKQVFDQSPQTQAMFKKYSKLHVKFFPYIYTLVKEAKETGVPVVRSLYLHYPADANTISIKDEFLLGDRVLVAPVLDSGAVSRSVYFPEGNWYDYCSGALAATGPATLIVDAPLDHLPIFVKEGTIIPLYNQPHIETLVKNVSGINDFEYADSTMELRFYGCGTDQLALWDSTLIQMHCYTGDSATTVTGGHPRQYTSSFINDNSLNCVTGILELGDRITLNVYPNPTSGMATVTIDVAQLTTTKVDIYTLSGSLVQTETFKITSSITNKEIDISSLASGVYLLTVSQPKSSKTFKIIKH